MVFNNTSNGNVNSDDGLVRITGSLGGADGFEDITFKEVTATESLLTPGLQTAATFQSKIYVNDGGPKNWQATKNQIMSLDLRDNLGNIMNINQRIYRLDNRKFVGSNVSQNEEMIFHACDDTLLKDAKTLVSKSWKCQTPSAVVNYVLSTCLGAFNADVQSSSPGRDYVADCIHPFQVIQQQANMALDGDDPSFIHWMTYGSGNNWTPRHHFRSLKSLTSRPPKYTYVHSEAGTRSRAGYNDPQGWEKRAVDFMFPCDYDLLSDLLNGLDEYGNNINSGSFINPSDGSAFFLNGNMSGCIVNGNHKQSVTNKGTSQQQNGCDTDVEKHLLRRQARMGLLEKDKVALRLVGPWNPYVHAGDVITFKWKDKDRSGSQLYGSGDYLIASMTHRVLMGGYSTTTLDCVAQTVGQGIV